MIGSALGTKQVRTTSRALAARQAALPYDQDRIHRFSQLIAGVLLCDHVARFERAVAATGHPLRQLLTGLAEGDPATFAIRPHPMAAVLAWSRLARWSPEMAIAAQAEALALLPADSSVRPLGNPSRHRSILDYVAVVIDADGDMAPPAGLCWTRCGAQVMPGLDDLERKRAARLLARVRLAVCAPIERADRVQGRRPALEGDQRDPAG